MDPLRDWANLPKHLLDLILERLELLADYLRFSVVCQSWYGLAKDSKEKRSKMASCHPPPMLLVPGDKADTWIVYNIMDNRLLDLQLRVPNTRFCGSSKGWLIYVEDNFVVTLVNPFYRVRGRRERENSIIHLPPLAPPPPPPPPPHIKQFNWHEHEYCVCKATISADPILHENDCIVVVITKALHQIAFIRLGKDTTWTYIDGSIRGRGFEEVIFLEDKFYGVQNSCKLLSFEVEPSRNSDLELVARGIRPPRYIKKYLVYTDDKELLMVQRYFPSDGEIITEKFKVYQLNFDNRKWTKKNTLGDIALFLGDNSSFSVLAAGFLGCIPGCIYFMHDYNSIRTKLGVDGPTDFGVYKVESKMFLPVHTTHASTIVKMSNQPPIWILPTFQL